MTDHDLLRAAVRLLMSMATAGVPSQDDEREAKALAAQITAHLRQAEESDGDQ